MSALFLTILHMSVCASWLVLAVLLLRLCLRRAPKWFNVLLWGIVAVRLVFPFSVESPLSLLPRTEAIRPAITTVQTQPAQISSAAAAGGSAAPAQSWLSILASGSRELPHCSCIPWSARCGCGTGYARRSACGETSTSLSGLIRRSCSVRSVREFISHIAWTAATGSTSLPTSRRTCAGATTCGSR